MNITWTPSLSNQSAADLSRWPSAYDANSSQLSSFQDDDSVSMVSDSQNFAGTGPTTSKGEKSQRFPVENV